ncbi:hypothetical protein [Nonomuraea typhae]|uniref:DUF423 domain-containing protein n=1 Tax=Nonomuraea typhae TaxID=2603600 RepID=A0ABW7YIR8_9ACTN
MVTQQRGGLSTAFRVAIVVNALAVLAQAVTAGQLLSGAAPAAHGMGAGAVHVAGLLLAVTGVLAWRPGGGAGWPALAGLAVLLLGFGQSMTGGSGATAVHVPLGVSIFGLSVWLLVWSFSPRVSRI